MPFTEPPPPIPPIVAPPNINGMPPAKALEVVLSAQRARESQQYQFLIDLTAWAKRLAASVP